MIGLGLAPEPCRPSRPACAKPFIRLSHKCRAAVRRRGQPPRRRFDGGGPMAVTMRNAALLTRRRLLTTAAASAAITAAGGIAKPRLSRAADRPAITHGIQSGDVSVDS